MITSASAIGNWVTFDNLWNGYTYSQKRQLTDAKSLEQVVTRK